MTSGTSFSIASPQPPVPYPMLPTALIHEIDRLLKEGELSHRKIAIRLGVSRGTIDAIANGRRGLYGKEPDVNRPAHVPTSPPARCPRCGYRVYFPCLICNTRQHKQREHIFRLVALGLPQRISKAINSPPQIASEVKRRRASLPRTMS